MNFRNSPSGPFTSPSTTTSVRSRYMSGSVTTVFTICVPSVFARGLEIFSPGPSNARSAVTFVSFGQPSAYSSVPPVTRPLILNSPLAGSRNGKSRGLPRSRHRASVAVPACSRCFSQVATSASRRGMYRYTCLPSTRARRPVRSTLRAPLASSR